MIKEYMPECIGLLFFFSTLAAKVGVGDTFDLLELAPHGMFAVVMILLLRYIPARDKAHREEMKEIINSMNASKEKEIERLIKLLSDREG